MRKGNNGGLILRVQLDRGDSVDAVTALCYQGKPGKPVLRYWELGEGCIAIG
jgi:hypothetical protein